MTARRGERYRLIPARIRRRGGKALAVAVEINERTGGQPWCIPPGGQRELADALGVSVSVIDRAIVSVEGAGGIVTAKLDGDDDTRLAYLDIGRWLDCAPDVRRRMRAVMPRQLRAAIVAAKLNGEDARRRARRR